MRFSENRMFYAERLGISARGDELKRGDMAITTPQSRESRKKLKPKPKTENKSWQTRNMARKEKQTAHAAKLAAKTEA